MLADCFSTDIVVRKWNLGVFQMNGLHVARSHLPQDSEALFPGSETADVK